MLRPIIFFIVSLNMGIATICNAQWVNISFPANQVVNDLKHTSHNKLWGYGGNLDISLFFSNNGGHQFTFANQTFQTLTGFNPIDDSIAFLIGSTSEIFQNELFKTSNGGTDWDTLSTPNDLLNTPLVELIAFDSVNLCLLSPQSVNGCFEIWHSNNGGNNWEKVSCDSITHVPNTSVPFFKVVNKVGSKCILKADTLVFQTINNGKSWNISKSPFAKFDQPKYSFKDSENGIAVNIESGISTLYETNDGGITWNPLTTLNDRVIGSITYSKNNLNPSKSYYLVSSSLGSLYSIDDGLTWDYFDDFSHSRLSFHNSESGVGYSAVDQQMRVYTGPVTSVSDLNMEMNNIQPFPNPSNNYIYFRNLPLNEEYTIVLYSIEGKKLFIQKITQTDKINVQQLKTGVYFYTISDFNRHLTTGKIIVY